MRSIHQWTDNPEINTPVDTDNPEINTPVDTKQRTKKKPHTLNTENYKDNREGNSCFS